MTTDILGEDIFLFQCTFCYDFPQAMKKVLFMPNGIGLAHVGRLVSIAKELKRYKVEIMFGGGSEAIVLIRREGFRFHKISEFSREIYDEKIKNNNWFIYNRHNFLQFLKDELALYRKVKPDLIVYDTKPTVRVSSKISGIPAVSITNVDATGYYDYEKIAFPLETTFGRYLPKKMMSVLRREYGQRFLKIVGKRAIPLMIMTAMIRIIPAMIQLGYKPNKDPFQLFLGDLTLIADIPEFRPIKKLPNEVKIIGPVFWDGPTRLPKWHKKIDNNEDIIYVTASGTGDKETFLRILKFLKGSPYTIAATTGNTLKPGEVDIKYENLLVTEYLPGDYILKRAKLIIFPGGNATCYQALSYGVPQICTPFHVDQEDNANQLERLGTGIIINPYKGFTSDKLLRKIIKIMKDDSFRKKAKKIREIISRYNGARQGASEINKILSGKTRL
ncbi:hypothetical protein A3I51_02550 [Candidatus Gottesmanbacteria bacterium RIFCSPLOWO2_02_FULL_38_8]|uniref:Erythromycin biosynthesis protein CIII-like C-terminal domain-containing protein n=1 Tax=Candidatus Gottesmanbacteria bacterium RIFCSPLOWO2_02_FULL_38_8 TaxID=1798397 RepID=A0A1F6B3P6_9BACT|nr:MAG: hypothetical protein A3I51_02550 [Candidatus Gottesmanbacteria bacterium RIFCSPLOWO2_02_FULL_38_8]